MPSRWNLAYRLDVLHNDLRALVQVVASGTEHLNARINRLEKNMTQSFREVAADLDALTTDAADKLEAALAANAELRAAVERGELDRAQALAAQDAEHAGVVSAIADRLRGLGSDAENPVPDASPLPEAPPVEASTETTDGVAAPADTDADSSLSDIPGVEPA